MSSSGIESHVHAERAAALRAERERADADLRRITDDLDRQRAKAQAARNAAVQSAARKAAEAGDLRTEVIAEAIVTTLDPLMRDYVNEDHPRRTFRALIEAWQELEARTLTELGEELAGEHLFLSLAAAHSDGHLAGIAARGVLEKIETQNHIKALRGALRAASLPLTKKALEKAEAAIDHWHRRPHGGEPPSFARGKRRRAAVTKQQMVALLQLFDAERRQAREESARELYADHDTGWGAAAKKQKGSRVPSS